MNYFNAITQPRCLRLDVPISRFSKARFFADDPNFMDFKFDKKLQLNKPVSTRDDKYQDKILALSARKSRQVFTSGGLEPVADGGREGHSLFAYYFLKALKENPRGIIDLENLFYNRVWGPVAELGDQRPYVGRLKTLMNENGQFVLVASPAREKEWGQLVDPNYAEISPRQNLRPVPVPNYNPAEHWTGAWEVEASSNAVGMWVRNTEGINYYMRLS